MGVGVHINKNSKEICIKDNTNSRTLFNMAFKAILNSVNIDCNGYTIVRTDS